MSTTLEREIKLRFPDPEQARSSILGAGALPLRGRRFQEDCLIDTEDQALRRRFSVLRVRIETGNMRLTFKGPAQSSHMKLREELETGVADGEVVLRVFERLGYTVWFRYQKYREEFSHEDVVIALDETPIGTYVEIEGTEKGITGMALALGRTETDYVLDSYPSLFLKHRREYGLYGEHMVFEEQTPDGNGSDPA
jgi:adenylate cyclase, class 2